MTKHNELLQRLRASLEMKIHDKWSRDIGAGFIKDDIIEAKPDGDGIYIEFRWGGDIIVDSLDEFNLRETEELVKFLESECD